LPREPSTGDETQTIEHDWDGRNIECQHTSTWEDSEQTRCSGEDEPLQFTHNKPIPASISESQCRLYHIFGISNPQSHVAPPVCPTKNNPYSSDDPPSSSESDDSFHNPLGIIYTSSDDDS